MGRLLFPCSAKPNLNAKAQRTQRSQKEQEKDIGRMSKDVEVCVTAKHGIEQIPVPFASLAFFALSR
jgi:hypothetical protein